MNKYPSDARKMVSLSAAMHAVVRRYSLISGEKITDIIEQSVIAYLKNKPVEMEGRLFEITTVQKMHPSAARKKAMAKLCPIEIRLLPLLSQMPDFVEGEPPAPITTLKIGLKQHVQSMQGMLIATEAMTERLIAGLIPKRLSGTIHDSHELYPALLALDGLSAHLAVSKDGLRPCNDTALSVCHIIGREYMTKQLVYWFWEIIGCSVEYMD